jgi:hypothetical protein
LAWFRLGIWKTIRTRGWGGGFTERSRCLLLAGEGSESYRLLKCPRTQRWREEFMQSKWPEINEQIAIRKTLTVKNAIEQRK